MSNIGVAAIGVCVIFPLLAAAHTGDHSGMDPVSTGLHHGALPLLLLVLLAVSFLVRSKRRKRAVDGQRFGRPSN